MKKRVLMTSVVLLVLASLAVSAFASGIGPQSSDNGLLSRAQAPTKIFLPLIERSGAAGAPPGATATKTPSTTTTPAGTATKTPSATTTPAGTATKTPVPGSTSTPTATNVPGATKTPVPTATATAPASLPVFSHVYTILMENKEINSIVGSSSAPYINSLIAQYGLATNYTGVAHPSEPNYIALYSGSTQGVTDDAQHDLGAKNVADQIEASGRTWKMFAQNVPLNCYTGMTASGGEDGTGNYARKHEPAISFTDISLNASRCANITDFTHFDPAAANYEFITPNLCNDMHDCSVATGDTFLKGFVPKILGSTAWQQGGVLFITWDEGTTNTGGGGVVATLVIASNVPAGFKSSTAHNHYSLLHTIENSWGLGCLANTCSANDLREFFH